MKLKRITLTSFAGVSDFSCDFLPGLNIVFGENEAGKSTIFHAITHALFTPAKLTKARFAKEMARFLPAGGGDTVKVTLDFDVGGGAGLDTGGRSYSLSKSWGAVPSAELTLPDGSLVTSDAEVCARVEQLLPASVAVMKAVLLTYQSGMEKVLEELKAPTEVLFDLREVMREALKGSDGINAERFRANLKKEIDSYYGRWDRLAGGPEQGRGIKNPWRQGAGKIVTRWYAVESLKAALEETRNAEENLAEIAGDLDAAQAEYEKLSAFLKRNDEAAGFAAVRTQTLHDLEKAREAELRHQTVYDAWPRAENRLSELTGIIESKKKAIEALRSEQEKGRRRERLKTRVQEISSKLKTVDACRRKEKAAREEIESRGLLTDEAYKMLQSLEEAVCRIERQLQAGPLTITVKAKNPVELGIREGLDRTDRKSLAKDERLTLHAEKPLTIEHQDFTITASSKELDIETAELDHGKAKRKLHTALAANGVDSMTEAAESRKVYVELAREAEVASSMIAETLAGESEADLQEELEASRLHEETRSLEEIQRELTTTEHEAASLEQERGQVEKKLEEYRAGYGSRDAVLDKLVASRSSIKDLTEAVENGPTLPEGFDDWHTFIEACIDYRRRRDELAGRILDLKGRRAELLARMPEDSAEETELRLEQAKSRLERTEKRAAALERILSKTDELLATPEIELSAELKREFEHRLYRITGGRYAESRFSDDLPDGLLRGDGAPLSFQQLSSGTRDGFSLALRLAVAGYFLKGADGFIMMDDPLVDMDDNRRPLAAAVLAGYAESTQTIVFTCHEAHAGLFDSTRQISL